MSSIPPPTFPLLNSMSQPSASAPPAMDSNNPHFMASFADTNMADVPTESLMAVGPHMSGAQSFPLRAADLGYPPTMRTSSPILLQAPCHTMAMVPQGDSPMGMVCHRLAPLAPCTQDSSRSATSWRPTCQISNTMPRSTLSCTLESAWNVSSSAHTSSCPAMPPSTFALRGHMATQLWPLFTLRSTGSPRMRVLWQGTPMSSRTPCSRNNSLWQALSNSEIGRGGTTTRSSWNTGH